METATRSESGIAKGNIRTFTNVVPPTQLEPDRHEWKPGEVIGITGIIISTETRFKELAKINGVDPKTGIFIKRRTTSEPAIKDLKNIIQATCNNDGSVRGDPVLAKLIEKKSNNGQRYYVLGDPGA